jgi:hypothetical protein
MLDNILHYGRDVGPAAAASGRTASTSYPWGVRRDDRRLRHYDGEGAVALVKAARRAGKGGCPPPFFSRFFSGRDLAIAACLSQRRPRRPLRRVPRRRLPSSAGRARRRVLHPSRVEGRAPAALVVAGQLEIVALARHADGNVPDASPPFRFGSRALLLIAAKGDSMSVLVASEIPRTRG